jgi:Na+-driven multidrug efflux pump
MFQQDPRKELKIIAVYIIFVFISLWYSCQLWKSSEGPEDYQKLALSEYLCIVLLSFLPRVYLFAFPETRLSIGQQKLIKIDE